MDRYKRKEHILTIEHFIVMCYIMDRWAGRIASLDSSWNGQSIPHNCSRVTLSLTSCHLMKRIWNWRMPHTLRHQCQGYRHMLLMQHWSWRMRLKVTWSSFIIGLPLTYGKIIIY